VSTGPLYRAILAPILAEIIRILDILALEVDDAAMTAEYAARVSSNCDLVTVVEEIILAKLRSCTKDQGRRRPCRSYAERADCRLQDAGLRLQTGRPRWVKG
jgi:hypothetical protein